MLPLLEGTALDAAAVFMLTCGITHHTLLGRAASMPAETLLVLAAAGGVGSSAIQIAKAVGARGQCRGFERRQVRVVVRIGADATIDQGNESAPEQSQTLTAGQGPDVVVDPVGGEVAEGC